VKFSASFFLFFASLITLLEVKDVNHLDFSLFSILLLIEHILITACFDKYIDTHIHKVI